MRNLYSKTPQGILAAIGLALAMLISFEGLSTHRYLDPVMVATICYGETDPKYTSKEYIEAPKCKAILQDRVESIALKLDKYITRDYSWQQRAAFISFVYNFGWKAFSESTMLRLFNAGDTKAACRQLIWYDKYGKSHGWIHAGGKVYNGLIERRKIEQKYCLMDED